MALTDLNLRKAKGREKPYRMSDERGLYVLVQPSGAVWWRFDYIVGGKRKTMSFGVYPDVSLSDARTARDEARKLVAKGVDPIAAKRDAEREKAENADNTFGRAVADYLSHLRKLNRAERTIIKNTWLLNDLAAPLHATPLSDVKPADVLRVLKAIEAKGMRDSAHTLRSTIGAVFRLAIANLEVENDPTFPLRGVLLPVNVISQAAVTDERKFGGLLRSIDEFDGWVTLKAACRSWRSASRARLNCAMPNGTISILKARYGPYLNRAGIAGGFHS